LKLKRSDFSIANFNPIAKCAPCCRAAGGGPPKETLGIPDASHNLKRDTSEVIKTIPVKDRSVSELTRPLYVCLNHVIFPKEKLGRKELIIDEANRANLKF
jgi:hypothetical protein